MMGANDVQAAQIDCVYEHGILLRFLIRLLVLSGSCNDTACRCHAAANAACAGAACRVVK
jgi:hypothetical protein